MDGYRLASRPFQAGSKLTGLAPDSSIQKGTQYVKPNFSPKRLAVAMVLATGAVSASPAVAGATLTNLLSILENTADGGWAKLSLNAFSDAWPDDADRSLPGSSWANTTKVISAWSSFAWDSARGDLLLFGGGHGNYAGNEVYKWSGTTQRWELASIPSRMVEVTTALGPLYIAADGAENAPTSIHTYDNTDYLPVADRMILMGGAAFNTGGIPLIQNPDGSLRFTGPYLFDPSKADGTKVGGTTGSANDPTIIGGEMWQNRDTRNAIMNVSTFAGVRPIGSADGTTAVTVEGGKDVVYFTGTVGASTDQYLFKYVVNDVSDPSLDTVSLVGGVLTGPNPYGAAGIDPVSGFYVALGNSSTQPFVVWDTKATNTLGNLNKPINYSITGAGAFDGARISGIDWDPESGSFYVWSGGGDVWRLTLPGSGVVTDLWNLELVTDGDLFAALEKPDGMDPISGVRGKWKYASNLNAFIALEGNSTGEVWVYRPEGWTNPVPIPEPGTYAMMALGIGVVGWTIARRRRTV
jgi:hypothetical protein